MPLSPSDAMRSLVSETYKTSTRIPELEQDSDFREWRTDFIDIHGELERKRAVDRSKIGVLFGLPTDFNLTRFVLAVEVSLAVRMRLLTAVAFQKATGKKNLDAALIDRALGSPDEHPAAALGLKGYEWPGLFRRVAREIPRSSTDALFDVANEINEGLNLSTGNCIDWYQDCYAKFLPKEIRHALGSYYTPEWLVKHVIDCSLERLGVDKNIFDLRVIDPTAGSGVFLLGWMHRILECVDNKECTADTAMQVLLRNIVGVDVNHLAVMAAQSNLIVAACILYVKGAAIPEEPIALPVIHGDALDLGVEPSKHEDALFDLLLEPDKPARSTPELLDESFDLVVGNPPWVNWEYMPPNFRKKHEELWPALGLFSLKGRDKSFSKEDVSALFFHYSIASFLANEGVCGMVLPQSLLKSSLNGRGFRQFRLADRGTHITVLHVDDMTDLRPFEGVANRTAVVYAGIGDQTEFPVTYDVWSRNKQMKKGPVGSRHMSSPDGRSKVSYLAAPASSNSRSTPWVTGPDEILDINKRLEGKSVYRGRTGLFTGGANAVYHVEIIGRNSDGTVRIRNIVERAKRAAPVVEARIEQDFLYPFLRGRDVDEWSSCSSIYVLMPHTLQTRMAPVSVDEMQQFAPLTLAYFENFREILSQRKGFTAWERQYLDKGFYAVQRVGDYTFAKYKVVWRYISSRFKCAVIEGDKKPMIPNEKLMLIDCQSRDEAYFLCGVLSSSIVRASVEARMVSTQIAPYLIETIRLPRWDPNDELHRQISLACRSGHQNPEDRPDVFAQIDALSAHIFEIDESVAAVARKYLESSSTK